MIPEIARVDVGGSMGSLVIPVTHQRASYGDAAYGQSAAIEP